MSPGSCETAVTMSSCGPGVPLEGTVPRYTLKHVSFSEDVSENCFSCSNKPIPLGKPCGGLPERKASNVISTRCLSRFLPVLCVDCRRPSPAQGGTGHPFWPVTCLTAAGRSSWSRQLLARLGLTPTPTHLNPEAGGPSRQSARCPLPLVLCTDP